MKLYVDDKCYETSEEQDVQFIEGLLRLVLPTYNNLDTGIKILVKQIVRGLLLKAELQHPEARDIIRPPKGADPTLHFVSIGANMLVDRIKDAQLYLQTDGNRPVAISISFSHQDESGGLLAGPG